MEADDFVDSVLVGLWIAAGLGFAVLLTDRLQNLATSLTITLTHPFSVSYTGGYLAYYALHPGQMYHYPDPIPYPSIYPPLVPYWFNLTHIDAVPMIIWGRMWNWIAIVTVSVLIAYHIYRRTGRIGPALAATPLYALSPLVIGTTVLMHVDHIALALTMLAFTAYTRDDHLSLVIVLCVAAGFAKQPFAILSTGSIAASMALNGNYRRAIWFGGSTAAIGLSLLAVLAWATDGGAIEHLIVYNAAIPWYAATWVSQLYAALYGHGVLFAIAIGVLIGMARSDLTSPFVPFFVLGMLLNLVIIGKEGAWVGYWYPVIAAAAVLAGDAIVELDLRRKMLTKRRALSLLVILMLLTQFGLHSIAFPMPQKPLDSQHAIYDRLEGYNTSVISEEPSIVPSDKKPLDVLMIKGLVNSGYIGHDPVARALQCGRWEYVVSWLGNPPGWANSSRWTEAQLQAIEDHYDPVGGVEHWSLYRYSRTPTCER